MRPDQCKSIREVAEEEEGEPSLSNLLGMYGDAYAVSIKTGTEEAWARTNRLRERLEAKYREAERRAAEPQGVEPRLTLGEVQSARLCDDCRRNVQHAFEATPSPPKPAGRTVRVRIGVAVAGDGSWTSLGYRTSFGEQQWPDWERADLLKRARELDGSGAIKTARLSFVTADVPLPEHHEPAELVGEVEVAP